MTTSSNENNRAVCRLLRYELSPHMLKEDVPPLPVACSQPAPIDPSPEHLPVADQEVG
jgi:hypothetical protein